MIKIGLEMGGSTNRYIYSYIPERDQLTLDVCLDSHLARLSVTCDDVMELRHLTPLLLGQVSDTMEMPWMILTGWRESSSFLTPARARLKEKKLRDNGYNFESKDGHRVGLSQPVSKLDAFFTEQLLSRTSYGICTSDESLLISSLDSLTDLVRSSARSFAAPNSESIEILNSSNNLVAFVICDDSLRPGIVVMTSQKFKFEALTILGDAIEHIRDDETADKVWAR